MSAKRDTYREAAPGHHQAVYDGRRLLGNIVKHGAQRRAYDADGQLIDTFQTAPEAHAALIVKRGRAG